MCSSVLLTGVSVGDVLGRSTALARGMVAAAVVMVAIPATAQRVAGDDPPIAKSGITSVPQVPDRGYRLEASLRTLFDDNLLRVPSDRPTPLGRSRSDFRFSPAVSGGIGLPFGRQQLYVGAIIGRDFYARNTDLNRNRYAVGGGLNWRLGTTCTGALGVEFRRRQNLFSEEGILVPNVQENFDYGGSFDCQARAGIGFGGTIEHNQTNNLTPTRRAFDVKSTSYSPHLSYGSAGLGRFSLGGSYTRVKYPFRPALLPDFTQTPDGIDLYSGRIGYDRSLGTRMKVTLGASFNKVKPQPRTVQQLIGFTALGLPVFAPIDRSGYSGLGYDGSLSYTPSPRISAQLSASRNVTSTPNAGALFIVNQAYGLDLGYKLGPSIDTGVGVTYNVRDYRGGFASPTEPVPRVNDKSSRFYARVSYSPVKLYDVDLEVAHQKRASNPNDFDFSGTSVSLTLRVKFGRG